MDIRMPVMDGIEALRGIVGDPVLRDTRVVMLTTFKLDEYVFESLRTGASGFLIKDSEPAELLQAIRVVAPGESPPSPTITRRVISESSARPSQRSTPLPGIRTPTNREREVVSPVAEGLTNDEIAGRLASAPRPPEPRSAARWSSSTRGTAPARGLRLPVRPRAGRAAGRLIGRSQLRAPEPLEAASVVGLAMDPAWAATVAAGWFLCGSRDPVDPWADEVVVPLPCRVVWCPLRAVLLLARPEDPTLARSVASTGVVAFEQRSAVWASAPLPVRPEATSADHSAALRQAQPGRRRQAAAATDPTGAAVADLPSAEHVA